MKRGRPPSASPTVTLEEDNGKDRLLYGHGTTSGEGQGNECMICGKSFSRGVMDLMRHSVAPTLRHLVAKIECEEYPIPCERSCGLWFSSSNNAASHALLTTCNPDVEKTVTAATTAAGTLKAGRPKGSKKSVLFDGSEEGARKRDREGDDLLTRGKSTRSKILFPDDRKAFFAVCSLLIDSKSVPADVKLSADNFDKYIPKDKKEVVEMLKVKLNYECS